MSKLVFLDTETTSLDADTGEIWEVGAIVRFDGAHIAEYHWFLPVSLEHASSVSLDIGRFHSRHPQGNDSPDAKVLRLDAFAQEFASLTHGAHLAGNVVSFDEERLRKLLRRHGHMPSWHYHLVDVETLAAGFLAGQSGMARDLPSECDKCSPPWNSRELSEALGVEPPSDEERHTALGDARWAMRMYDAVMGGES